MIITIVFPMEVTDFSGNGKFEYETIEPGDYRVVESPGPYPQLDSRWWVFPGTSKGASIDVWKRHQTLSRSRHPKKLLRELKAAR